MINQVKFDLYTNNQLCLNKNKINNYFYTPLVQQQFNQWTNGVVFYPCPRDNFTSNYELIIEILSLLWVGSYDDVTSHICQTWNNPLSAPIMESAYWRVKALLGLSWVAIAYPYIHRLPVTMSWSHMASDACARLPLILSRLAKIWPNPTLLFCKSWYHTNAICRLLFFISQWTMI